MAEQTFRPPAGVRAAAKRALKWIADGHAGANFTDVGRRRASQLAGGQAVSADTIRRMNSFFARHSTYRKTEGWRSGEPGFPAPSRVAWDAWGGDPGAAWARGKMRTLNAEKARQAAMADLKKDDLVEWESSGGTAYGQVVEVVTEGTAAAEPEGPEMDASEDQPAYRIQVWQFAGGEWGATDTIVVHRGDALTVIESLPESKAAAMGAYRCAMTGDLLEAPCAACPNPMACKVASVQAALSSGGRSLTGKARETAAKKGEALPDGKLPTRNKRELRAALNLRNKVEGHSATEIRKYLTKRARDLKAEDMLPEEWTKKG
jgi:hypothetical protein